MNAVKFFSRISKFVAVAGLFVLPGASFAEPVSYVVDAKASKLEWIGSKVVGSTHNGVISIKDGMVKIDGDKSVTGEITVDMKTIVNLDLTDQSFNAKLVGHLSSDDFFDVAKYPTSKLTLKQGTKGKDGKFSAAGDLTMKSSTKPVKFVADLVDGANGTKTVTVDLAIDRTEWDIRYGSGKFFKGLGDKMINDEFKLKATIVLTAAPAKTAKK